MFIAVEAGAVGAMRFRNASYFNPFFGMLSLLFGSSFRFALSLTAVVVSSTAAFEHHFSLDCRLPFQPVKRAGIPTSVVVDLLVSVVYLAYFSAAEKVWNIEIQSMMLRYPTSSQQLPMAILCRPYLCHNYFLYSRRYP